MPFSAVAASEINTKEVEAAQIAWGNGIVAIGKAKNPREAAIAHIDRFYGFDEGVVLFKPTLASVDQFRGTKKEALSYFIGQDMAEDSGFALAPYVSVRWENEGIVTDGDSALAMGNYYFTDKKGNETKGSILVRAGLANVSPDASSSALTLDGVAIGSSEADVDDNTQLGLTFAYMFHDNFAVEVLASTPFKHDITAETGVLGLGEIDAGQTKHLPPTVSLLYYPNDNSSRFQPYVGAGVNYTLFFDETVDSELEAVLGDGSLELDPSWGWSAQVGVDYMINDRMFINGSVWWIDIDTDADFRFPNNRITTQVDIDPLVYQFTLGWRF
eukprot:g15275.t1